MGQKINFKVNLNYFKTILNKIYQNLWATEEAVLRYKFVIFNGYIRKEGWSKSNNLRFHLRTLEKQKQFKAKAAEERNLKTE